ncbi:MAG: DNA-directed RNA polymerase subunit beta', partial [Erysipelotrichaceae bacterium]|nr:DNA-directed RNA polymerase subunit beta' [Erysipelotrichaceae bacterium]
INELVLQKIAQSSKFAEKMIDRQDPQIWDVLEEIMDNHPVFLNRAPTLHRLGIQAFKPKLVEGRAIRLHPLVCTAFNADFDGDQMAVHLPLSEKARAEAEILMMASNNILGPKDGKPIVTPSQDMVLGNFYLNMEETKEEFYKKADFLETLGDKEGAAKWRRFGDSEGHVYKDFNEALMAYQNNEVHLHTRVAIKGSSLKKASLSEKQNSMYLITTIGKLIFNSSFPSDFPYINYVTAESLKHTLDDYFVEPGTDIREYIASKPVAPEFKKKDLGNVIAEVFARYRTEGSSTILDAIKDLGFEYSTVAGMTVSLADINVAPNKQKYVDEARKKADVLQNLLNRGQLTPPEWERHFSKLWADTKDVIGDEVMNNLERKSPINMMAVSGARGNKSHFTQLAGMRGLMGRPTQSKSKKEYQPSIIEVPIYSSFREGLNVSEFFISTHGVRKGLTDTALKTAESGYLTRRLVDVAQDVMIMDEDCHTDQGYYVEDIVDQKDNSTIEKFYDRIVGRYAKEQLADPATGEIIIDEDEFIDEAIADKIIAAGYKGMNIRNSFTCKCKDGICRKCYGRNMATGKLVESGEAIGIMAAQSIGEPGTQLTMRTFHSGGVANADDDITQGLPRVEELFEARCPKHPSVISKIAGEVTKVEEQEDHSWIVEVSNDKESIAHKCGISSTIRAWVKVGAEVRAGAKLTEGNVDPKELLSIAGVQAVQNYILKEVKKVYAVTGIDISDKHVEVIIKQMLKKVIVVEPGGSELCAGQTISLKKINDLNTELLLSGKQPAKFEPLLLGISKSSVETDSFLSAASFQETTKVLTDAAVNGKVDNLFGIKENVIIGKLIPAGTGSKFERETTKLVLERAEELDEIREEKLLAAQEEASLPSEMLGEYDEDADIDANEAEETVDEQEEAE